MAGLERAMHHSGSLTKICRRNLWEDGKHHPSIDKGMLETALIVGKEGKGKEQARQRENLFGLWSGAALISNILCCWGLSSNE